MTDVFKIAYIAVIIFVAYRIGNRNGGAGIVFFLVGLSVLIILAGVDGDCIIDWDGRSNPLMCD